LYFYRLDLTADKRYTISEPTKDLIKNLKDQVIIKVYLEGSELNGGFERLKRAVSETLVEFKTYGKNNIDFQFIDPNVGTDEQRKKLFEELVKKGMQPTNIIENKAGRRIENMVFPYATIWYQNKEVTVLLLKANQAENAQGKLNQSFENIEYELAAAIQRLSNKNKKKIGLLTEFTTLSPINFAGLITSLQEFYDLFIINAKDSPSFIGLDALILPKPDIPIDDSTKLKIDQYVMQGGRVLFFVDGLKIDSIGLEGTFAQPLDVNLDDLFFKYGLRINKNIVKDGLNAAVIPLVVGNMGDKPNIQLMPYRYFPLINNFGNSLITKNIDMVYTRFSASIDPVNSNDGLTKTPLLLTSPYTKILNAPALITYNETRTDTEQSEYNAGIKNIAYLVEGKFKSLYANRISGGLIKESPETKILVVSDGDIIVNPIDEKSGNPMPLGYDKYTQHQYGNQDFVLNSLNYLIDQKGLIVSKSKNVSLRPLDSLKSRDERLKWQIINVVLPILVLAIFGLLRYLWIKKQYTQ
jgi:gliding-associated putative ABC transporter substrate-binding component GldG